MGCRKLLQPVIGVILAILPVVGCGAPAEPPTPIPPTAMPTPEPPTPTPSCGLECTGSEGPSLSIIITCESGEFSSVTKSREEWDDDKDQWVTIAASESDEIFESITIWKEWDEDKGQWGTRFEGVRTYKNSGNEYKIVAVAYGDWEPQYHVEVTGGVFGDEPQYCQNY
jgi:hypothetical protein